MILNDWISVDIASKHFVMDFKNTKNIDSADVIDDAISKILSKHQNLYLALSGGIDSEFVANCLYERKVYFTPIIIDFGLNNAETWYAYYWCYRNNIQPDIINISIDEISRKFSHIALTHNIPFITAIDILLEEYVSSKKGKLITAAADPFRKQQVFGDRCDKPAYTGLELASFDFAIDTICKNVHPTNFFLWTPELLLYFISGIDYNKPIQIALCDLYRVPPRPKFSYVHNVIFNHQIMNDAIHVNNRVQADLIKLGDKDSFIRKAMNKEKIYGVYERLI